MPAARYSENISLRECRLARYADSNSVLEQVSRRRHGCYNLLPLQLSVLLTQLQLPATSCIQQIAGPQTLSLLTCRSVLAEPGNVA